MKYSENEVHEYIYKVGLEPLLPEMQVLDFEHKDESIDEADNEDKFIELWKIIKRDVIENIQRIHQGLYESEFIASKLKLPIDDSVPIELDLLGQYSDGLFILELKVNKSAERNSFTELLAYSSYFSDLFALSSHRDITNVLVANLDAKITKQAYLYDVLINRRNTVVYKPNIQGDDVTTLKLDLFIPEDSEFQYFSNSLLAHEAMSCVVVSFDDIDGWIDSEETAGGSLNKWTRKHLEKLSSYVSQLMESENLHGFCYVRKPWAEIPLHYRNSLIICAVDPFYNTNNDRIELLSKYIDPEKINAAKEYCSSGFIGRLIRLAQRAIKDSLEHDTDCEIECPFWGVFVSSFVETVSVHNFGFRPTGIFRLAYVSHINSLYEAEAVHGESESVSVLKVNDTQNWLRAWEFMRACGLTG